MNPIQEAAIAIEQAQKRHPGLAMRLDVSHKYVHVVADLGDQQISRTVSWADMNVLSATVALAVNAITGKAF